MVSFKSQWAALIVLVSFIVSGMAEGTESSNSDVLILTESTFDEHAFSSKHVVVEFYAPWCGHCKNLAPIWEKFATAFKDEPHVVVANVDATKEAELAKRFGVNSYPTIRYFPPDSKEGLEQGNFADLDKFVDWMNEKAGTIRSSTGGLKSTAGKVKLLDRIVMGIEEAEGNLKDFASQFPEALKPLEGHRLEKDAQLYVEILNSLAAGSGQLSDVAAEIDSDILSAIDSETRKRLQVKRNVLGSFVGVAGMNSKQLRVFAKENGIDVSGIAETRDLRKAIIKMLPNISGRIDDLGKLKQSLYDFVQKEIREAEEKQKRRELQKTKEAERKLKREKARREELAGPVKVARDYTFNRLVLDKEKDVLVEFYAPWCGHCKSLAPIYDEIGEHFKDSTDVLIVKVDATSESKVGKKYQVSGYPTLVWFPKDDKSGTLHYKGERTKDGIITFIENGGKGAEKVELKEEEKPKAKPTSGDPSAEDGVTKLTDENFDTVVLDETKDVLVEFYAPWCGHCKNLQPIYAEVASRLKDNKDVVIAKLDSTAHKAGNKYDVQGFPTIKAFKKNSKGSPEEYNGARTVEGLIEFITGKAPAEPEQTTEASIEDGVTVLTDSNFKAIALDEDKDVLVEFYAPWCGHCKVLAPTYSKLGLALNGKDNVVIAKMDATVHKMGSKYGVKGFPTIKLFPKGGQPPVDYQGARTEEELTNFVKGGGEKKKKKIGEYKDEL